MSYLELFNHIKKVAQDDLRIWAAPFVAIGRAVKAEFNRPSPTKTSNNFTESDK